MSNSRSLSVSLNPDGVPDASGPRGDRHAGHRHLAAGLAGRPFRNLPTVAAALAISLPLPGTFCPEQGALGCRGGGCCPAGLRLQDALSLPPISNLQSLLSAPAQIFLRRQSRSNPRAFTPALPAAPAPKPPNPIFVCF